MSSKKKAIKKLETANAELEKSLAGVRRQLAKIESELTGANEKAERWKKEAAALRTAASRSDARTAKLRQKLDRARVALKPVPATNPSEATASDRSIGEPTTPEGLTVPDTSWTVVQLRAEARSRGLTGLWSKTKAELLAALT